MIQTFNTLLGYGTLLTQALIVVVVASLILKSENVLVRFLRTRGLLIAFLIALAATGLSLLYSDVFGYAPCKLCWYQRIFIYPQVIVLGIALLSKERRSLIISALIMSILGAGVAASHHLLQMTGISIIPCSAEGVSCAQRFVFELGYITFPLMSFTSFLLSIVSLSLFQKNSEQLELPLS